MDNNVEERLLRSEVGNPRLKQRIWIESKKLWRVGFASIIARISQFGLLVVTQSFMGHISALDLAAYALVQTISLRFVNGILLGMASATETLCGQAFGAGQHHMMGIYLQRSWIIDFVTATILLPMYIFATPFFRLLGEEDDIAKDAENISLWFIPIMYSFVFGLNMQMYLQAQSKNMVIAWLAAISFCLHVLLSWIFVSVLSLGIPGAMGALIISSYLVVIGEFVYIFGGWCPLSWKGFTIAAFNDIFPVVKLSISSGIMLCLELWYYAILVLVAGYMTNAEVAISAFSICLNVNIWEFMISLGFLGASCVRVANELGSGNAEAAKFSIKVALCTSLSITLFFSIICLVFGQNIAYLFTSNEEVADEVSNLSGLLALTIMFNGIQPVLSGVAVGTGLQSMVAYINLLCYYVIGVPIGALLGFVADMKVKGVWIGLICGVAAQTLVLGFMIWRVDWNEQVKKASERLNQWLLKPEEESKEESNESANNA